MEEGTSEKNVNTPLSSALDLPFPFPDTWMGPMVQHCNARQNYQPIEAVKAQGIFLPPANIVHNAPFGIWRTERQVKVYKVQENAELGLNKWKPSYKKANRHFP